MALLFTKNLSKKTRNDAKSCVALRAFKWSQIMGGQYFKICSIIVLASQSGGGKYYLQFIRNIKDKHILKIWGVLVATHVLLQPSFQILSDTILRA